MNPGPEVVAGYYMALINPAIAEFQTKGDKMFTQQKELLKLCTAIHCTELSQFLFFIRDI